VNVANQCVVSIDYTLTDDDGNVIDASEGRGPLAYLHGAQNIIPGLESELENRAPGDEFSVTLEPSQAYGDHDERLIQDVPREQFEGIDGLEVGIQLQASTPEGVRIITVKEIGDQAVTVDANHPLAGQRLHFDVAVREVREATETEVEHGHVHDGDETH